VLKITESSEGIKGRHRQQVQKPATCEPVWSCRSLFIKSGELIKVSTA